MAETYHLGSHAGGTIHSAVHFEGDEILFTDTMPASEVQKILDQNAAERQLQEMNKRGPTGNGAIGARIPLPMWQSWHNEWKAKYKPYMRWHVFLKRRLNSNEYQNLVFQKL